MDGFFASTHFINIKPIPHAFETLLKLKDDYDLHIVTSRQFAIQDATLEWIELHYPGLFSAVHFGNHYSKDGKMRSKPEMCRDIGAVLLIDDSLQYAMHCYKADIPVLLFGDYAWNQIGSVCATNFDGCDVQIQLFDPAVHSPVLVKPDPSKLYRLLDWREVPRAINFLLGVPETLSVAAIQMCSVNNKLTNLRTVERLVQQATRDCLGLQLVCLPECCVYMGESGLQTVAAAETIDPDTSFPDQKCMFPVALSSEGPSAEDAHREALYDGFSNIHFAAGLCEVAHLHKVWLSVGGFPEKREDAGELNHASGTNPSISNTHFLISPEGKIASPLYRKIHLFDAPLVNLQESKTTSKHACS